MFPRHFASYFSNASSALSYPSIHLLKKYRCPVLECHVLCRSLISNFLTTFIRKLKKHKKKLACIHISHSCCHSQPKRNNGNYPFIYIYLYSRNDPTCTNSCNSYIVFFLLFFTPRFESRESHHHHHLSMYPFSYSSFPPSPPNNLFSYCISAFLLFKKRCILYLVVIPFSYAFIYYTLFALPVLK